LLLKWYDLTWVEWLSVATVPLTIIGFYITLRQLAKTKSAAEAATKAVGTTQRQLAANQLLVLVPQLKWLATELDVAIQSEDASLTRRHLDSWRWQASHINGLLTQSDSISRRRAREVQDSIALATTASTTLLEKKEPVLDSCKQAREAIGKVCNELSTWIGQQSLQPRETPNEQL
jgi:hypothetical protein